MNTLAVCLMIVGLVLVDLLAIRFGRDSRADICAPPERWVGGR